MLSVVIPTYNAASFLPLLLERLREQTMPHELIIIDSESSDGTLNFIDKEATTIISIDKQSFNHGSSRNIGLEVAKHDIVVFMTQDALPTSPKALENLVSIFKTRTDVAMSYGRQLPYPETGIFGRFARLINYPSISILKTKDLVPEMGIKTCSCSNSFAAYRKTDLQLVGSFPSNTILGEDVSVAARFILKGQTVAYCAEAEVFHSHDYTVIEEFKRYFDIGVFHLEQKTVLQEFSKVESEGLKYVFQEWQYLIKNGYAYLIPLQVVRVIAKYSGYKLGKFHEIIPLYLKRRLSMQPSFWK